MNVTHWPPPCIIGALTTPTVRVSSVETRPVSSSGTRIGGWPNPPPPSAATKMSSARPTTPLAPPGQRLGAPRRRLAEPAAAQRGEEDVLGSPHDALREARGAAGIEKVRVV